MPCVSSPCHVMSCRAVSCVCRRTKVNGGAVEVAETFLKALPPEEGNANANALPPTTPPAVAVDDGGAAGAIAAAGAEAGGKSQPGGAAATTPRQRFKPIALITTEERAAELREVLREMLIEFLELCRQLVLKSRTVLNVPRNTPTGAPRAAVGEEKTAEEVSERESLVVYISYIRRRLRREGVVDYGGGYRRCRHSDACVAVLASTYIHRSTYDTAHDEEGTRGVWWDSNGLVTCYRS